MDTKKKMVGFNVYNLSNTIPWLVGDKRYWNDKYDPIY